MNKKVINFAKFGKVIEIFKIKLQFLFVFYLGEDTNLFRGLCFSKPKYMYE